MLLKRLVLENVGVFREVSFDLSSTKEKPVILFGGRNGAGKTTLFESIMLCLYGISFFDKKISRKEYEKFLKSKIHRYLQTPVSAKNSSIAVEFSLYHHGEVDEYFVKRSWDNDDGTIKEQITIQKNKKELDTVEQSQWQSFIEELIPRGIAKLFFFDGEKVVKIAQEGTEGDEIQTAFDSLLGVDLVQQLHSDLRVSIVRNMGQKTKEIQQKLDDYTKEKQETLDKTENYEEKLTYLSADRNDILQKIEAIEANIAKVGGGFAQIRQKLFEKKSYLNARMQVVESNIKSMCSDLLPFCVIPNEINQLKMTLLADQEITKKTFEKEILESKLSELKRQISDAKFWEDLNVSIPKISSKIFGLFDDTINKLEKTNQNGIINYSIQDTTNILNSLEKANRLPKILEKEALEYQQVTEEMRKVEIGLASAPKDDEVGPLISQMSTFQNKLGTLDNEIDHIQQQLAQEQAMIKILNSKIRNIVSEKYKDVKSKTHVDMANKVLEALDDYVEKLKARKLEILENYLLEATKMLLHKENFVEKVEIDRDTFAVLLYSGDNTQIQKDMLSEGEKQMLATALLWALAKTSGKPLPFIIDTPLARLDVEHRENLISKFFPVASHQTLILSTNAEIDEKYYPKLKEYVNKSYYMEYQSNHGRTKVEEGYFPEVEKHAV